MQISKNKIASRAIAAVAVAAVAATGLIAATPAQAATPTVSNGDAAAGWLATQFVNGAIPSTWSPGTNDWGLTADAVLALASRKAGGTAAAAATDVLADHVANYTQKNGPDWRSAGATAKLLLVAVVQGRNPNNFGGVDLPAVLAGLKASTGPNAGRYRDVGTGPQFSDYSGTFSQSLAILGLGRSGVLPADAVSYLIGTQCANGGFPSEPDATTGKCTSDADASTDTTSMALQALLAPGAVTAPGAQTAREAAVSYLDGVQKTDGSFDNPPWEGANASSTGLAAAALRAANEGAAAANAESWMAERQLTCANAATGKAAGYVGAIMYDPASLTDTVKNGVADDDQPRRTTAQAVLGFTGSDSLVTMDGTDATALAPRPVCAPTKTVKVPATPTIGLLAWSGNRKSVKVTFKPGAGGDTATGFSYRSRQVSGRSAWSSWKSLSAGTRSFAVANGRLVQFRANNATGSSATVQVVARVATTRGALRGCKAPTGLVVNRRGSTPVVSFAKRTNSCAKWRSAKRSGAAFGKWKSLKRSTTKLSVSPKSGAVATLQIRSGKRTTTVYVSR